MRSRLGNLPAYQTRDFESALLRKGFRKVDGKAHKEFWLYVGGLRSLIRTHTSRGEREFDDYLLKARCRQMGELTKGQFADFMECCMGEEELLIHLREKGKIPQEAMPDS